MDTIVSLHAQRVLRDGRTDSGDGGGAAGTASGTPAPAVAFPDLEDVLHGFTPRASLHDTSSQAPLLVEVSLGTALSVSSDAELERQVKRVTAVVHPQHGFVLNVKSAVGCDVAVINAKVCRVLSCPVVSCPVVSCRVVSCRVVSCRVVSCRVVSCRVVSCRVVSCRVASR
jgi:hypothetical protein